MVVDANIAARRYQEGVDAIGGAGAYYQCGTRKGAGFLAVAECMEGLKVAKGTTADWARRYAERARG